MKIDLKQDLKRVEQDLAARVKNYGRSKKGILGKPGGPIRLITLGFSYDQSGWTALVFDTRPDAEMDGEWQNSLGPELEFDHWPKAIDDCCENETKLTITLHDGSRRTFTADFEQEEIAECFGLMCRAALERAWEKGLFSSLPLVQECKLVVEDHVGFYGWKSFEPPDEVDEDAVMEALCARAAKLSKSREIDFWLAELECLATGRPCESTQIVGGDKFVIKNLLAIGKHAGVPLLTWANRWAKHPEYKDPRTLAEDEDCESASSGVCFTIFSELLESKTVSREMEKLTQKYIRTATQVPPVPLSSGGSKRLVPHYGIVPTHAARYLKGCYAGYPSPITDSKTNQLHNAEAFLGSAVKKLKPRRP